MEIGFQDSNSMNIFPFHGSAPDQDQYISGLKATLLFIFNFSLAAFEIMTSVKWWDNQLWVGKLALHEENISFKTNYGSQSWAKEQQKDVGWHFLEKFTTLQNFKCLSAEYFPREKSHTEGKRKSIYNIYTPPSIPRQKNNFSLRDTDMYDRMRPLSVNP